MSIGIAQLKKLRGRSLRELRTRGQQELAKIGERLRGSRELSDSQLRREIHPASRNGSGEGTSLLIRERIRTACGTTLHVVDRQTHAATTAQTFFPALAQREQIVAAMEQRFPEVRRALIDRADRACAGRFDLLGFHDLSFGQPIDWHLEPISGKRTPLDHWSRIDYLNSKKAGDKKITWELNRHAHFVTFGQAYWLTGDERYAEAFVAQATAWMDANPVNRGINWASSLELAFRAIAWLWALHLFADSRALDSRFVARLLKFLIAHGRHIQSHLSTYFSPNTHLTGEALGLFYLGTALPELKCAAVWRATGQRILLEQLPIHIRKDGVYFEQTTYYHRYTVDFYLHLVALARAGDLKLPDEVEARLSRAMDYLMWTTRPGGAMSLVGDDDGGRLIHLGARAMDDARDTLATGAALLGRGDWKYVAGDAAAETLWLLGPAALARYDELQAPPPTESSRAFVDSGYFVMRDGWSNQSTYVLIDAGLHGASSCGHAHADALAFEFAANGETWLVDPGTFTYTGDAQWRDGFRSSEAHNTVTADGQSQSLPAGPFAWQHIAQATAHEFIAGRGFDYFEGAHDGYQRLLDPVTHTRSLLLVKASDAQTPAYLIVRDEFDAKAAHHYAARYHFAAGCETETRDNQITATTLRGELNLFAFGTSETGMRIEDSFVSRVYGQREAAPVAVIETDGEGAQEMVSFIVAQPENAQPADAQPGSARILRAGFTSAAHSGAMIDCRETGTLEACAPRLAAFNVCFDQSRDIVITGDGTSEVECESLTARGRVAVGRFAGREFVRGCLIQGDKLEAKGCFALRAPAAIEFCEIQFADGTMEITIHGASRFALSFYKPSNRVVVNNSSVSVNPACRSVAFVLETSGWKMTSED